jgi:ribosomal-protein-alanine N-acetyltransferase
MAVITQTSRIVIREFLPEEKDLFFNLMADSRINAYLPKRSHQQIRDVFIETIAEYLQGIKLTRWGIFNALNGDFIGLAILRYTDEALKAELGYVLHLCHHGKGLATEMAKALVGYGFEKMNLKEIFAVTDHENVPSQQVLLKAGFTQGEHIVRHSQELSYFEILKDEWARLN